MRYKYAKTQIIWKIVYAFNVMWERKIIDIKYEK